MGARVDVNENVERVVKDNNPSFHLSTRSKLLPHHGIKISLINLYLHVIKSRARHNGNIFARIVSSPSIHNLPSNSFFFFAKHQEPLSQHTHRRI